MYVQIQTRGNERRWRRGKESNYERKIMLLKCGTFIVQPQQADICLAIIIIQFGHSQQVSQQQFTKNNLST